ncbi:MAG: cupin domain-containing protein [Solirubrobacteraceae bacterium]
MSYAKKNLREIEDQALKHGFSEHQAARFARGDLSAADTGLAYVTIKPGHREAFAHRHREAEEIAVVLSGSGQIKLDDDLVELAPLDAVRVSPGVTRAFEAGDEGLEVVVFGPHVAGDAEMVQGFARRSAGSIARSRTHVAPATSASPGEMRYRNALEH